MVNPRRLRREHAPDWSLARWIRWRYLWWLPTKSELRTAWLDARARMKGYCNDCPVRPGPGDEGGGYAHWRCALRRGHEELHRYRNYVWPDDGRADYDPVPIRQPMPEQDRERDISGSWLLRLARMRHDIRTRPRSG